MDDSESITADILYAGQFFFQWLSLLIFVLEYLSTEQEVRKVLGLKTKKQKREIYLVGGIIYLVLSVIFTYLICEASDNSFYNSWPSTMGEVVVSGSLLLLQFDFIRRIFKLIKEADLDLITISRTFCANLSVVGFLFLVQCGDLGL